METPRTAERGHGVSAIPARPGGRAMPRLYPGPELPEVLLARAASGVFVDSPCAPGPMHTAPWV